MIKGSVMLRQRPQRKWTDIFRTWISSGHIAIVIHCADHKELRAVQKSVSTFKGKNKLIFWTHSVGNDLYLVRPDPIKKIAMEVKRSPNGTIYFYDSEHPIDI